MLRETLKYLQKLAGLIVKSGCEGSYKTVSSSVCSVQLMLENY